MRASLQKQKNDKGWKKLKHEQTHSTSKVPSQTHWKTKPKTQETLEMLCIRDQKHYTQKNASYILYLMFIMSRMCRV